MTVSSKLAKFEYVDHPAINPCWWRKIRFYVIGNSDN